MVFPVRERVDDKYRKKEREMDANIAAHDARMARTQQDVSNWKSSALQPGPPASNGEMTMACTVSWCNACSRAC
jgi:ABC-type Fe3+-citrate transport system substrate-binding protein